MRIAMIRPVRDPVRLDLYNIQEIGLAKALLNMGVSTDVFIQIDSQPKTFVEVEKRKSAIIRLYALKGIPLFGRNELYPQQFRLLHAGDYDVVQSLDDNMLMSVLAIMYAKKHGIKTILYQGMYDCFTGYKKTIQNVYDFCFQALLRNNTDLAIAKTNMAATYLRDHAFNKIYILPVGLDTNKFVTRKHFRCQQLQDFKNQHGKILLYVGKIERRRQVKFLIEVLCQVRQQINAGLVIVGDGPEKTQIETLVAMQRLSNHVLFVGAVPQNMLPSLYESADVFVLASRYEIFGMVILEALYHGLPVISTRTGGALDILIENYLGRCVDLDVTLWCQAITGILDQECYELKSKRKEYVKNKYDWNKLAKRYLDIIKGKRNACTGLLSQPTCSMG